jgi:hypothetical protein
MSARELSRAFYGEVVRPLVAGHRHAAGLLGWGSDVLGYDTARSTDHGWGPRLIVFVDAPDAVEEVQATLDQALPERFRGWPVRYGWDAVPATHWVTVNTLPVWLVDVLGVDATAGMSDLDWLITPQQRLLGVVGGAVYATTLAASPRPAPHWGGTPMRSGGGCWPANGTGWRMRRPSSPAPPRWGTRAALRSRRRDSSAT